MQDTLINLKPIFKGGQIDFSTIDTTPGSISWAAPPIPVPDYTEWLRVQYKEHISVPVYLNMAARMKYRRGLNVNPIGPHKEELLSIMKTIAESI